MIYNYREWACEKEPILITNDELNWFFKGMHLFFCDKCLH